MLPPPETLHTSAQLVEVVQTWRGNGYKVVFTNGVFDILHPGHIAYLKSARQLGDRLIVGLNSDRSCKLLNKGASRPLQDEMARATILCALRSVDAVCLFDGATPLELIEAIMPDVLVKGGDYTPEQIVGSKEVLAAGGRVKSLQFIEGYSTTAIEQKILNAGLTK